MGGTATQSRPAASPAFPGELSVARVSDEFTSRVPPEYAREKLIISQGVDRDGLERLVVAEPDDLVAHNVAARLERRVRQLTAPPAAIAAALDALRAQFAGRDDSHLGDHPESATEDFDAETIAAALDADERDLLKTAGRAPVVKLVNALLFEALEKRASDVHVQPGPGVTLVRYRVDGALSDAKRLPARLLSPIVSRIKVMARMDIAERRLPQDGRAVVTIGGREVDLRVSTLPTAGGERAVVRLLDKRNREKFDLAALGMPPRERELFARLCARPHGMILVTGPTGSGKTTTLYAALSALASPEVNVLTLEDPIEYELPGVSQSQIASRKGVTFATGLRHLLRQDPDVIMVGEIRDAETARTAIQSALTGHMVFSTLHTNSAAGAVARLLDLGVEPYLLNASLTAVLAQRLVRTICSACGGQAAPDGAAPCPVCGGRGMAGRQGLFELLVMDDELRQLIVDGASAERLHEAARRSGMRTLRDAGLSCVGAGVTTQEEVDRVTLTEADVLGAAEGESR